MLQAPVDYFRGDIDKTKDEFEEYEKLLYEKSKMQFPNRNTGRITNEILPSSIDEKRGLWAKYKLPLKINGNDKNHISILATETEWKTGYIDFNIEIGSSPAVSVNNGKNNLPISLDQFNKFQKNIERDFCLNPEQIALHNIENSFVIQTNDSIVDSYNRLEKPRKMTPSPRRKLTPCAHIKLTPCGHL